MAFKSIFQPSTAKPKFLNMQSNRNVYLRDQFTLSTWLLLGASGYASLSLISTFLLPRTGIYLLVALFLALAHRAITTILQIYDIIPNPAMAKVIPGKVTTIVPDMNGNLPEKPGEEGIVVMFLGVKSNHPLGTRAPGFKEVSGSFRAMIAELNSPQGRKDYGILGVSSYLGTSSATSNETLTVMYWRSIEGVHAFAESPVHRAGWDYWNHTAKQHPYLSISHEVYRSEGRKYENVYVNFAPTLIGGLAVPVVNEDDNEKKEGQEQQEWMRPLVEANRGKLASSKGRLGW